jgi:hypothetical protein
MIPNISTAIYSLANGVDFILRGETYSGLEWLGDEQTKPTESQVNTELARLQAEYNIKQYQRNRAAEYPSIADYIDGVVKGDQSQIDAYIAACQAVKAKYPKP